MFLIHGIYLYFCGVELWRPTPKFPRNKVQIKYMLKHLILFLKGFSMGLANVVPGVSGGTIALLAGILNVLYTHSNHSTLKH